MSFLCNTCDLNTNIENHRIMLNNLIVEKNHNLLDEEIINLSQYLDVLLCKCISCNKDLDYTSKLNLKNIVLLD